MLVYVERKEEKYRAQKLLVLQRVGLAD